MPDTDYFKPIKACLDRPSPTQPPSPELDRALREREPEFERNPDPENRYLYATDMAFCDEKDMALRLLKSSIAGNYCVYVAMQKDPMMAPLRSAPEFPQLLSAAKQCQDKFLAERNQAEH